MKRSKKNSQLDMFDVVKNSSDEASPSRHVALKAPMIVDSYDASISEAPVNPASSSELRGASNAVDVHHEIKNEGTVVFDKEKKGPHIYSVTELTTRIKDVLEGEFPDVWICGEVTDFRGLTSRHCYFSLKDENKNKIRLVIFGAGSKGLPFELKDGMEVICHGRINVYGPGGSYSMIVDHMEPKGIGALQIAFEQLKEKLSKEGLFASERKKKLPFLVKRIGIVTSSSGAAIRDIIHVLKRRFQNVEILIYSAKVQGEGAAKEIAEGIAYLNTRSDLDVIIIGRGGGSIEDLWAFNEEVVARAIAASSIPIISAVGHEIDFTISDFVADVRAATPSAAAEIVVPMKVELLAQIDDVKKRVLFALEKTIQRKDQLISGLVARMRDPRKMIPDMMRSLDVFMQRLMFSANTVLERKIASLSVSSNALVHLSPLAVLSKGYSVVTDEDGRVVKSYKTVKEGKTVNIIFGVGMARARIIKLSKEK